MRYGTIIVGCALASILAGFSGYTLFTSTHLLREQNNLITQIHYRNFAANYALFTSYGIVQSTDAAAKTVVISVSDPFLAKPRIFTLSIDGASLIERQELVAGPAGAYASLSDPVSGTLADLVPGTRVAFSFKPVGGRLVATTIFFGNPI